MTTTHILLVIIIVLLLLGRRNSLAVIQYIIGISFFVFLGYILITTPELKEVKEVKEIAIWVVSAVIGLLIITHITWKYERWDEPFATDRPKEIPIWIGWIGIIASVWGIHTVLIWLIR